MDETARDLLSLVTFALLAVALGAALAQLTPGIGHLSIAGSRIGLFPLSGQPVRQWRRLARIWLVVLVVAIGLHVWAAVLFPAVLMVGMLAAGWLGFCGFVPWAAQRHADNLQSLKAGHCAWCGVSFGRERPVQCPACGRRIGYGRKVRWPYC